MYITQNPFFHGMLSLLVARFQSLKLLETGNWNKLFQQGEPRAGDFRDRMGILGGDLVPRQAQLGNVGSSKL